MMVSKISTRSFRSLGVLSVLATLTLAAAQAAAPVASANAGSTLNNGRSVHGVASAAQPDRVVDLAKVASGELNIVCGETVQFRNGDKTFAWKFESVGHRAVDLRALAPAGFTDRPLWVFVERNDGERS